VVETGPEASGWKPGDRIALAADIHCGECFYCRREWYNLCLGLRILGKQVDGALCEYMLLPAELLENGIVNRVPEDLSLLHAAVSEPMCSVLASHDELAIESGESVVVIGAGPMGILHYLLLCRRGAHVILIDQSRSRLELAQALFAAPAIVCTAEEDAEDAVYPRTHGVGADAVICTAPSSAAVRQSFDLARRRGRIGLFCGLPPDEACVNLDANRIHYYEQRAIGNFSYHPRYHRQALDLLDAGVVDCEALITTYPLEAAEQALQDIRAGRVLKAVITPGEVG
jgi:L-iditol 2-dehydrogenase